MSSQYFKTSGRNLGGGEDQNKPKRGRRKNTKDQC